MNICSNCGQTFDCTLGGMLHILTTHSHSDICVSKDITKDITDEGCTGSCLACLLRNTIPLDEYYRILKEKAG